MQVRVDYSLTLFGLAGSYSIPALDGDERMPEWGWCQTKMNEAGTAVELHCMEPRKGPIWDCVYRERVHRRAKPGPIDLSVRLQPLWVPPFARQFSAIRHKPSLPRRVGAGEVSC